MRQGLRTALTAVSGKSDGIAFLFQIHLQKLRNVAVIFHD